MSSLPAPLPLKGLRHLALRVTDLAASRAFYEGRLGLKVVWEPDAKNVYLSSGTDNLALHQIEPSELANYRGKHGQLMDHFGFVVASPLEVERLHDTMSDAGVTIVKPPKRHRDGSVSFYLADPDGNVIQFIYEPTLSHQSLTTGRQ